MLMFPVVRLACAAVVALFLSPAMVLGQPSQSTTWLAGRYDSSTVVVYFQAVKFNHTFPADAQDIPAPIVGGFFSPKAVSASTVKRFQKTNAEPFDTGKQYDLLLGGGRVVVITLSRLVAYESDEFVGNDSYIGALGSVAPNDLPLFNGNYFAVRRHNPSVTRAAVEPTLPQVGNVQPDLQAEISGLLRKRLLAGAQVPVATRTEIERAQPSSVHMQSVTLGNGSSRYYAYVEFRLSKACLAEGAWIQAPPLRIIAVEEPGCERDGPDSFAPQIQNAVALEKNRVGLIVSFVGGDGYSLQLLEYRDNAGFNEMRKLQDISFGE